MSIHRKIQPASRSRRLPAGKIVFLFDVDNTLLDNDRVIADLTNTSSARSAPSGRGATGLFSSSLRTRLGYADYLGALQRYRSEYPHDLGLLAVSRFLINYPFANRLFPELARRYRARQAMGNGGRS